MSIPLAVFSPRPISSTSRRATRCMGRIWGQGAGAQSKRFARKPEVEAKRRKCAGKVPELWRESKKSTQNASNPPRENWKWRRGGSNPPIVFPKFRAKAGSSDKMQIIRGPRKGPCLEPGHGKLKGSTRAWVEGFLPRSRTREAKGIDFNVGGLALEGPLPRNRPREAEGIDFYVEGLASEGPLPRDRVKTGSRQQQLVDGLAPRAKASNLGRFASGGQNGFSVGVSSPFLDGSGGLIGSNIRLELHDTSQIRHPTPPSISSVPTQGLTP
jgi:hypothetical protein